jgi:2-hydroxycyclohexanecarboxyl-CoA dehydrogenase
MPTDKQLFKSFVGEGEYGQKIYGRLNSAIPMKRLGQQTISLGIVE